MTKEVAPVSAFSLDRPSFIPESGSRGSEKVRIDDLTIPRVDVIQSLSPQRKKSDPMYIEGAEEGMLFNSVTSELYGSEVVFVPVYFRKEYVIWRDRKQGGGFRGAFATMNEAVEELSKLGVESHDIIDTAQHFGLIVRPNGDTSEVVFSMSRTKMKTSRKLNTMIRMTGEDSFARAYKISSSQDKNEKGEFYNIRVTPLGYVSEEIFRKAEILYGHVSKGQKDVSRDYGEVEDADSSADEF